MKITDTPTFKLVTVVCERCRHESRAPKGTVWPAGCARCGGDKAPRRWFAKQALDKARALVAAGRVEIGNAAAKAGPNAVRVQAFHTEHATGLTFQWSRPGVGFGELTLVVKADDGRLIADMERMSDKFCLGVLEQALKEAKRQ